MKQVIYPGTFDPITNGHLDIILRARNLFDKVIIGLLNNSSKVPLLSVEERLELIKKSVAKLDKIEVEVFDGLLIDFAKKKKATAIIRGLRAVSDFEYEFQMALMNRKLSDKIEIIFLMPNEKYTYLNSTIVKELAKHHADISEFVPKVVKEKLDKKFSKK